MLTGYPLHNIQLHSTLLATILLQSLPRTPPPIQTHMDRHLKSILLGPHCLIAKHENIDEPPSPKRPKYANPLLLCQIYQERMGIMRRKRIVLIPTVYTHPLPQLNLLNQCRNSYNPLLSIVSQDAKGVSLGMSISSLKLTSGQSP